MSYCRHCDTRTCGCTNHATVCGDCTGCRTEDCTAENRCTCTPGGGDE